jgi:diaminopimelate epimerase
VSRTLGFSKYHGTGNDFVMVFDPDDTWWLDAHDVAALCDRRFGVGADGLIRIVPSADGEARWFMDYRNADGSDAEMCGNGIRCVAAMLRDVGAERDDAFAVATRAGVRRCTIAAEGDRAGEVARLRRVAVEMGVGNFTRAAIPMRGPAWETFLEQPFDLGGGLEVRASAVSFGNPHLVLFVDEDPDRYHVGHIGPAVERHELFPEGVNVEFAAVADGEIRARVWERGSGETMACGSGACAVAIAANEAGLVPARTVVRFPGGALEVERRPSGEVVLTGEAAHVFDGTVVLDAP